MKKVLWTGIIALFLLVSTTAQTDVVVHVEMNIAGGSIHSDTLNVSYSIDKSLGNLSLRLVNSEGAEIELSKGLVDTGENIIGFGNVIDIVLADGDESTVIGTINVSRGTWSHLKHVYINWTFGQPAPLDNQGFAIGAMRAIDGLNSLSMRILALDDLKVLAEAVRNVMFGSSQDLNGDGEVTTYSDPFGFAQYVYGMRDHISNAIKSSDADPDKVDLVKSKGYDDFSSLIDEGSYSDFSIGIGTSDALLAKMYQIALPALNVTTQTFETYRTNLTSLVQEVYSGLRAPFDGVRDIYYGLELQGAFTLTKAENQVSTESTAPVILSSSIIAVVLIRRRGE